MSNDFPSEQNPQGLDHYQQYAQIIQRGRARLSLDAVPFWVNPDSFQYTTEVQYVEVPTLTGFGFNDFGVKPYNLQLDGWTGAGGRYWLDQPDKMRKFRPTHGKPNVPIILIYAVRFAAPVTCRIISFTDMMDKARPFAYHYQIVLRVYPTPQPSYTKVYSASTNNLGSLLPTTNTNPVAP